MEANLKLHAESGTKLQDPSIYRRLIGRLLYLTISRPDICYAVHKLSQFVSNPHTDHMNAATLLLRYLKQHCSQEVHTSNRNLFSMIYSTWDFKNSTG
nr:hypothetical protein KK1_035254 [Cajanus cajan]